MKSRHFLILAVSAAVLSACSDEQQPEETAIQPVSNDVALEGSGWQLTEMIVLGGHSFIPEDPSDYTLVFRSEGRLTGKSDCNSFTAQWNAQGSDLRFDDLRFTRSMCIPGSLHNYFSLYLRDVTAATLEQGQLQLTTTTPDVRLSFQASE